MIKNWSRAIDSDLLWEGGFADRSDSRKYKRPEYVNFGITLTTYQHFYPNATKLTIKNMTREQAVVFYSDHVRPAIKFDELPAGLDIVALHCATMFGPNRGTEERPGWAWFHEKAGDDWAYVVTLMMHNKMHRDESDWHYMAGWSDRLKAIYETAKEVANGPR